MGERSGTFVPRWPLFTLAVTALQVALFFAPGCAGTLGCAAAGCGPLLLCPWQRRRQLWRLLSYMLVHRDSVHLLGNVLLQLLLGGPLEVCHGGWRLLVLHQGGVAAGALAHSMLHKWPLAGASAAVYALIGAHAASFLQRPADEPGGLLSTKVQLPFAVLVGLADATACLCAWPRPARVSAAAHVAGLCGGFLVALGTLHGPACRWPLLSTCSLACFCLLVLAAALWTVFAA